MKSIAAIIFIFLFATTVRADDSVCMNRSTAAIQKRIPVSDEANYFLRPAPGTRTVGFVGSKSNMLLNLETAEFETVPGTRDPVLSPDGKILSIPQTWQFDPKTGRYSEPNALSAPHYEMIQGRMRGCILRNNCAWGKASAEAMREIGEPYNVQLITYYRKVDGKWQFLTQDPQANADYQAMGVLRSSGGETSYRTLFEKNGKIMIRDYGLNEKGVFAPIGDARQVCSNLKLAIPALSKDGCEISAFEPTTSKTRFISIGEDGKSCDVTDRNSLPFIVGKADFSPDGSRIGYHIDRRTLEKIMRIPGKGSDLKAVIYDRKAGVQIPLPGIEGEDFYYPVFVDDSTVAFISATREESRKFFINTVAITGERPLGCADCLKAETESGQLAALLGYLRGLRCHDDIKTDIKGRTGFQSALYEFSQMKTESCKKLARACDGACLKDAVQDLDKNSRGDNLMVENAPVNPKNLWDIKRLQSVQPAQLASFCESLQTLASAHSGQTAK